MLRAMCLLSPAWLEALAVVAATVLAGVALGTQWADAKARRKSTDAAVGAEAYVVRRTIRSWIIPILHGQALGVPPTVDAVAIVGRQDSGAVEERLQRMVAAAPHASPGIQKAVREAYVLYYKAKGPGPKPPDTLADLQAKPLHVRQAQQDEVFGNLQACVERLTAAIDPELRDN
jgi:hypothetical protein